MEPAIVAAGALLAANPVAKLLGPLCAHIGGELGNLSAWTTGNLRRIFDVAIRRVGDKIDQPGAVPPRVLREVVNNGAYHDDDVAVEYFGGVLASSRSGIPNDDRGACICKLIDSLSTYQIRTHYVIYSVIKRLYQGEELRPGFADDCYRLSTAVPGGEFLEALDVSGKEQANLALTHSMAGLKAAGLLQGYATGHGSELGEWVPQKSDYRNAVVFEPSALGTELFLWAHGKGDVYLNHFFHDSVVLEFEPDVAVPETAARRFPAKS